MEKNDSIICINNERYERELVKHKEYRITEIMFSEKINSKIVKLENLGDYEFTVDKFILKKDFEEHILTQDRDIIEDVSIHSLDPAILENYKQIIGYANYYWSEKLSTIESDLRLKNLDWSIWIAENKKNCLNKLTKDLDEKSAKSLLRNYTSQTSQEELVINSNKNEYLQKQKDIIEVTREVEKMKAVVASIKMKSFQLLSISNSLKTAEGMY